MSRKFPIEILKAATVAFAAWPLTSVVAASPKPSMPAQDTILRAELAAAHHDKLASITDRFARQTVDPTTIGSHFVTRMHLHDGDALSGISGPFYSYQDGQLTLNAGNETHDEGYGQAGLPLILVGYRRSYGRPYVAQNGFGAKIMVRDRTDAEDAVAVGPSGFGAMAFTTSLKLAGPEAKVVAMDADIVIEGDIAQFPGKSIAGCDTNYINATLDNPENIYIRRCWVVANITSVSFVRRSTGEVLERWSSPIS